MLPQVCPDGADILQFGWRLPHASDNIDTKPYTDWFYEFLGEQLLERLTHHISHHRTITESEHIIIFLSYSDRGIVTEKALVKSHEQSPNSMKSIAASTAGVLFFSTPFSGSRKFITILERLHGTKGKITTDLAMFHPKSKVLRDLSSKFGSTISQTGTSVWCYQSADMVG